MQASALMHLPPLLSSSYLRSEPFRLANGQYGQYEFYNPFVITQSSYASRKAHILVIYIARLASRSFTILEDEDDDELLDDDLSEQHPDLNIEYETFFFVSMAKSYGHISYGRFAQIRKTHARFIKCVHQNNQPHASCRYCMDSDSSSALSGETAPA